jgi:DNA transformation protein and related proteins
MAAKNDGFKNFVLDQLADLHGVTARVMFGGYGLYHRSTFFGIIHKDRLYFKVTESTAPRYKKHGMKPFRPNAKQTLKSFYEVPVDVIEDAEALTQWATEAAER